MCEELCAKGLTKPTIRFSLSKEERAELPGVESKKLVSQMTPEEYKQHRIFRNAYEAKRREFFVSLESDEHAEYQRQYHFNYNINHAEDKLKPYLKEYYKKNPEHALNAYRRRRALKAMAISEPYTEQEVLDRYGTDCKICEEPIDLDAPRGVGKGEGWERGLHIDHTISISDGGPDTLENVRPLHSLCNLRRPKGSRLRYRERSAWLTEKGKMMEKKYRQK